jgi:RimJ/RimL family protein N-acetyltransferase
MGFRREEKMMFGSKEAKLKDGTVVLLRPMVADDGGALFHFFQSLPEEVLFLIRHDVRDPKVIHEWTQLIDYEQVLPLLALVNGEIVGDATLHRVPHGWKRHIGRVRIVVSPQYQGRGLATLMLNELVRLGYEFGLEKLWAEVPLDAVSAIRALRNAGFGCKAVIEGMVKDTHNQNIDVLIMVCDIPAFFDRSWKAQSG